MGWGSHHASLKAMTWDAVNPSIVYGMIRILNANQLHAKIATPPLAGKDTNKNWTVDGKVISASCHASLKAMTRDAVNPSIVYLSLIHI